MSSFTRKVRITFLKGMEAIGTTASALASNAKLKVNEINLETRRREILTNFSLQAFELWQKGVQLPEPLSEMLTELTDIEGRLSVLRAQKYAKVNDQAGSVPKTEENPAQAAAPAEAEPAADGMPIATDAPIPQEAAAEPEAQPDWPSESPDGDAVDAANGDATDNL